MADKSPKKNEQQETRQVAEGEARRQARQEGREASGPLAGPTAAEGHHAVGRARARVGGQARVRRGCRRRHRQRVRARPGRGRRARDVLRSRSAKRARRGRGLRADGRSRSPGDARHLDQTCRPRSTPRSPTLGPVDVAVDVIGEARWGRTIDLDDTAWDESFDLVLRHFFNLARVAGRHMSERGTGAIVAIASVSGLRSAPLHGPYGAAKAGLMSLVRTLAVELGAQRRARERGRAGLRSHAAGRRDDERGAARGIGGEHPARPARDARRHRPRRRVPQLRSRVVHHRADAGGRRRRDRAVPAFASRLT